MHSFFFFAYAQKCWPLLHTHIFFFFQILVNNKPADFPASTKNLHAFLITPTVHIKSDYGVHVTCSYKLPLVCTVRVSGFYHGKLRGLLGDGDNEQYDDFTLPSGKVREERICSYVLLLNK